MTSPAEQLQALAELATAASVGWPAYESTEAALSVSTISNGGGDGRSSDVPDPVYSVAASHERYNETAALVAEALGVAREIQRRMSGVRRQSPEVARAVDAAVRAARCDGSVDPTCARNAVRTIRGRSLCWSCIRIERAEHQDRGRAS